MIPKSKDEIDWNDIEKYRSIMQLPEEIWLPMEEGCYNLISNYGRMKSMLKPEQPLIRKIGDNGNGYKKWAITKGSRKEGTLSTLNLYVHRMVAKYFLPNPNNLPQVNHTREGLGKHDNRAEVLEWCTGRDNILDAHDNGQMDYRTKVKTSIDVKPDEFVSAMYRRYKETGKVGETAREFGVPRTSLSSIVNKRSRVKLTDAIDKEFETNKGDTSFIKPIT